MAKKRKFYKKKKVEDLKELPSNSRTITEKIFNDHSVFFIGVCVIIVATGLVINDFYYNYKAQDKLLVERGKVISELNFWNREVIEKPNYRDGYFSLALIYYKLGDIKNSFENLNKAMKLDPNFEKGKELQEILENI